MFSNASSSKNSSASACHPLNAIATSCTSVIERLTELRCADGGRPLPGGRRGSERRPDDRRVLHHRRTVMLTRTRRLVPLLLVLAVACSNAEGTPNAAA